MNPLEEIIRTEIGKRGPVSFERFMGLALYHPEYGYYATANSVVRIGARGDFFTAVSVGSIFGRLLARRIARWWNAAGAPAAFDLVEWGAHDGQLANDLLTMLERDAPPCFAATRYAIVEPIAKIEEMQRRKLAASGKVRWARDAKALGKVRGVIVANELLDSLPFRVFERATRTREMGVGLSQGALVWQPISEADAAIDAAPQGWRGRWETRPSVAAWMEDAAAALEKGRIVLFDYGWTDEEYFAVPRPHGTARAYRGHRRSDRLLANPGDQDLTAHVRWTSVLREAMLRGLEIEEFLQQGRWLSHAFAADPWTLDAEEARQFNTLSHPDMMGEPFRVLVLKLEPKSSAA